MATTVFLDTSIQIYRGLAEAKQLRQIESLLASATIDAPRFIKDQPRVERLLTTVLQDARSALGQSACWPLGDIVILLQVPADAMVWSLDADFRVLTNMLGLKQYTAWIE